MAVLHRMSAVALDLRYAVRVLLRNRRFTLAAVLAMALGVGAASAVFSVVDRILQSPVR